MILHWLLFKTLFFLLEATLSIDPHFENCRPRTCGNRSISYPFWIDSQPSYCGFPGFHVTCRNHSDPYLDMSDDNPYHIRDIFYDNHSISLRSTESLSTERCPVSLHNLTLDRTPFYLTKATRNLSLFFNCTVNLAPTFLPIYSCSTNNKAKTAYYSLSTIEGETAMKFSRNCGSVVTAPVMSEYHATVEDPSILLRRGLVLGWNAPNCSDCHESGGRCGYNVTSLHFVCFCSNRPHLTTCPLASRGNKKKESTLPIVIGVTAAGVVCILACIVLCCYYHRRRSSTTSSTLLSRDKSSEPSSKYDLEKSDSKFYGTHVFSYKELEEATDNFDESKELGDGGFGTVYYGKLRDGRSVAVKRLYENNYKRVEQFMNEVEILSRLRHRNLVSLYGCTSRHSRELLLVYEFVPNGTVADHLHGNHAQAGSLTWPIRLSIAIETAKALKYLHAVEPPIIHRDVKTNNILLDNNFHVKVADFGLSRLFPTDVTHVSTAPQGTPGYVDPDYHKCYQLTDKSDVYSFGVVLVELISSKPAVDITRHRHEINLACMAVNKIHNQTLHELVDPELGFESDYGVRRMITLVAELAFRCLQEEKEVRPSMEEVVEILEGIESGEYRTKKAEEVDHPSDHVGLLKDNPPLSPDTVMDSWVSRSTTPNTSG